ncbi:MAG: hypothetical protein OEO77_05150 [Acidimicrobiia bacterium]|nr:hypothetical protein [Acidimicrobiia bacterium]
MSRKLLSPIIAALFLTASCGGSGQSEQGISLPPEDGGVTVSVALASDSPVGWIRGFLLADRDQPVMLCEVLAESFPPQCGGAALILRDGVLWREPYSDSYPFGEMPPGGGITDGVLTTDEPCGYKPDGPCAGLLGVAASGDVLWTDVAYSVIGTVNGGELRRLQAPPGGDL